MFKLFSREGGLVLPTIPQYDHILTKEFLYENYIVKRKSRLDIAKLVGCSDKPIKRLLEKFDIPIRTKAESKLKYSESLTKDFLKKYYIDKEFSTRRIGDLLEINPGVVNYYLKLYGIELRQASSCNRTYKPLDLESIVNLTSPEVAYWLGFIAADGNICYKGKSGVLKIKLSRKDREHLERFKQTFQVDNLIEDRDEPVGKDGKLIPCSTIRVTLKGLGEALEKWNIIPNKSLVLQFPNHMPKHLLPHYIRGYFDGDGCVSFSQRTYRKNIYHYSITFYSGSKVFLHALKNNLLGFDIETGKISSWGVSIKHRSFYNIYKLFYENNSSLWLSRKKIIFDKINDHLHIKY